jgi:arylsulfatase A-like enzyme
MTGQYAHNSGVRRNNEGHNLNHDHTLQRYLYEGGYRTALLGKFINGWPKKDPPPYFERFAMGTGYYTNRPVNVDGTLTQISQYLPTYLGKRAGRILEDFEGDDSDPWMMVIAPSSPHRPATPARRDQDVHIRRWRGNLATFERRLSDKPPTLYPGNTHEGVEARPVRKTFARAARALVGADRLVNSVFEALRALGEQSNTLAFFMSDNGYLMGEHGLTEKRYPYPMSHEIPLFMRWPDGGVPKGRTDKSIVANIDILPTVLEAAGLEATLEHEIDGLSLRGSEQRNRLLLEHFAETRRQVPTWASLITDREQYTEYYELDEQTKIFTEYYDIVRDPWYLKNLLGDPYAGNDPDPLTLEALADQLEADRLCAGTSCP